MENTSYTITSETFYSGDTAQGSKPRTFDTLHISPDYKNSSVTGMITGRESYSAVAMVTGTNRREGNRTCWFIKSIVCSTNRDFQTGI